MYNSDLPTRAELPTSARLWRSTLIAIVSAIAILVVAILPGEYGIDPTGVGRVLGLIGYGAIARETARLGRALGMEVIAADPNVPAHDPVWAEVSRAEIDPVLRSADVVSLHVPLLESTRHMMNATTLARMRKGAILINAARGGVVQEEALVEALASGHLGGAALDVFETEPLTAEAAARFKGLPNLILTPHVAGVTEESNVRVSTMIADLVADRLNLS